MKLSETLRVTRDVALAENAFVSLIWKAVLRALDCTGSLCLVSANMVFHMERADDFLKTEETSLP